MILLYDILISLAYFTLFASCAIFLLCLIGWMGGDSEGRDWSLDTHRRVGTHQVIYPDGQRSQRFTLAVARDYAAIFGGRVVRAD